MNETGKNRTKWAEDRTVLANERTFAGWMKAGMGAIGLAIALQAVFGKFDPTWAARLVASFFLLIAILVFWSAYRNARSTLDRISDNDVSARPASGFGRLALAMSVGALAVGVILWLV